MRACQVGRQVEDCAVGQAVAVDQAGVMLLEQRRAAQLVGHLRKHPGGNIDIAVEHAVEHAFAAGVADLQVDARRFSTQGTDQSRQDDGSAVVGHGQAKSALGRRRIEGIGCQQGLHLSQRFGQRRHQFQCSRSGHKTRPRTDQQRIPQ
ncbi:hypothetical protein D3C81_1613660 [compost metagenome]